MKIELITVKGVKIIADLENYTVRAENCQFKEGIEFKTELRMVSGEFSTCLIIAFGTIVELEEKSSDKISEAISKFEEEKIEKLVFLKKVFLATYNKILSDLDPKRIFVIQKEEDYSYCLCNGDLSIYEGEFIEKLDNCIFRITKQALLNFVKDGFTVSLSKDGV